MTHRDDEHRSINVKSRSNHTNKDIYRLRDEKQKAQVENAGRDDLHKRNAEISIFLRKQPTVIKEYDEKLVRRLIDKVTFYEDRFEVVFRSGVMVEV